MISEVMPYEKQFLNVFDHTMAYIDTGQGDPIVFLHGNPTSSYLWRNILPYLQREGRSIAPDLIGMGDSQKLPGSGPESYTFIEHRRYLDALFAQLRVERNVTLVTHDWSSALGFDWANRHQDAVTGIAYMEAIVQPVTWDQWSPQTRSFFEHLRGAEGEQMILEENSLSSLCSRAGSCASSPMPRWKSIAVHTGNRAKGGVLPLPGRGNCPSRASQPM